MKRFTQWIKNFRQQSGTGTVGVLLLLGLITAGTFVYLVNAESPWDGTVTRQLDAGLDLGYREYGIIGLWWASWVNLGLSILGMAIVLWWRCPLPASPTAPSFLPRTSRAWVLAGLFGAIVVGTYFRAPRLNHSLWNDEEYALRKYTWGEFRLDKDGQQNFKEVPWKKSLFANKSNNHLGFTLPARAIMGLEASLRATPDPSFNEVTFRLFPFFTSIGSIALLVFLGHALGNVRAGLVAAYLLALNPWHIIHSTNARGYAPMLFWIILGLLCMLLAVKTHRWRWWLGFGICQMLMAICFPLSLWVAVVQNLGIPFLIMGDSKAERVPQFGRWLIANLISAMAFFHLFAPSIPQILSYAQRDEWKGAIHAGWLKEWWSFAQAGMPWMAPEPELHLGGSGKLETRGFLTILAPLTILAGFLKLLHQNPRTRVVILSLLLSGVFHLAASHISETYQHIWYVFWPVVGMVLAAAWAAEWISHPIIRNTLQIGIVLIFALLPMKNRLRIRNHALQPMRETVAFIRQKSPMALTVTLGPGARQTKSYDPMAMVVESSKELEQAIGAAKNANQPLYVYFAGNAETQKRFPALHQKIMDELRLVTEFKGLEALWSYQVYQLPE